MSIDDCPKRAIDCTREFGKIGATLDLLLKDLTVVRDKQDDMAEQLVEIRLAAAAHVAHSDEANQDAMIAGVKFGRKTVAALVASLIAAGGAVGGALIAALRSFQNDR